MRRFFGRDAFNNLDSYVSQINRFNYINGNYYMKAQANGTRIKRLLRSTDDKFLPEFPDSIDIKITNVCSKGCPFCHESSCPSGASFNLDRTIAMLDKLPPCGIEIAIGGGNILEIPEPASKFICWCKEKGFSPRITLNYDHLIPFKGYLESSKYSRGFKNLPNRPNVKYAKEILDKAEFIGVSLPKYYKKPCTSCGGFGDNYVFHVIIGLFPIEDLEKLLNNTFEYRRLLFLGFKQFGRAKNMKPNNLDEWKKILTKYIFQFRKGGSAVLGRAIGFDNLAIEQLGIGDALLEEEWENLYFGDEFSHSMYVDAVNETFAPTSRSPLEDRVSWSEYDSIISYFKKNRND